MNESLLHRIVEGGVARRVERGSIAEPLIAWLRLEPDARVPDRDEILGQIMQDVAAIDDLLSAQLDEILGHPKVQELEAAWRGLQWLCEQIEDPRAIKVRVLDASWGRLARDLEKAIDFDQSELFRKVYSAEFDMSGGQPYGVLLANYAIRPRPTVDSPYDDLTVLRSIAQVAAAAFAPFIASVHPTFLGLERWSDLDEVSDLARRFQQVEYTRWNALRASDDARFVGLVLPRVLLRLPWPRTPTLAHGFRYRGRHASGSGGGHLFGSAIWALGAVLVRAFSESEWLASIRGVERDVEGGGLVVGPAIESFETDAPGTLEKGITDVLITDAREKELADLGFMSLAHCHGTSFAAFCHCPSAQRPKLYSDPIASANARLSAMLHYMLCVSRFAHFVKLIGRDRLGSFATADDFKRLLEDWLHGYTIRSDDVTSELAARAPLSEFAVDVREVPGRAGILRCVIHLRPHFQLDQLSPAIKLETDVAPLQRA